MNAFSSVFMLLALPVVLGGVFMPHKVSYSDLIESSEFSQTTLADGLTKVGLVTVTDIPGFADLREKVLNAASDCVLHTTATSDLSLKTKLSDGTSRFTLAAETNNGETGDFVGADLTFASCEAFNKLEGKFREIVKETTKVFAKNVDKILGTEVVGRKLLLDTETNQHLESVSSIVEEGVQLEHFHTYEKYSDKYFNFDYTLDVHKDQGLFIALAPALSLNGNKENHGFFIQLSSGEIVEPNFGEDNNELVFMIGDGFTQWINPKVDIKFRATPHAVVMPKTYSSLSLRSWYGRMILPKDSAFLEPQQKTFGELRAAMSGENAEKAFLSACSSGLVSSERHLQECLADQTFCWNTCQDNLVCPEGLTQICAKFVEDEDVDFVDCGTEIHGGGCGLKCLELEEVDVNGTVNLATDFCNGFGTSMHMTGFEFPGSRSNECIVFLFEDWILDSAFKYLVACAVAFGIGFLAEAIVAIRRHIMKTLIESIGKSTLKISLYALQVTFGYIAMLIAMTYSIVLFAMVILGLTFAHRLFNFNVKPSEFSDPCCADPPLGETKEV